MEFQNEAIKQITDQIREVKDAQLDLAQKEHTLYNQLMTVIDQEFMQTMKNTVLDRTRS